MRTSLKCLGAVAVAVAAAVGVGPAHAQQSNALTQAEVAAARALEQQRSQTGARAAAGTRKAIAGLEETPSGRQGKSVVTSVVPVGSASTNARSATAGTALPRRAVVTRFDYATGATIRTTIDLATNQTLAVREDLNYPTALAPEELAEAKALLTAKVASMAERARAAGAEWYHLTPVAASTADKRYGHRLVWLWLAKPKPSEKYLVDLSTAEVEPIQ